MVRLFLLIWVWLIIRSGLPGLRYYYCECCVMLFCWGGSAELLSVDVYLLLPILCREKSSKKKAHKPKAGFVIRDDGFKKFSKIFPAPSLGSIYYVGIHQKDIRIFCIKHQMIDPARVQHKARSEPT